MPLVISPADIVTRTHIKDLPKLYDDLETELCRRKFLSFVKKAWEVIEPDTPLHMNFHIEAICDHLQALTFREIQNCIINIPPGFLKSILVSVMWPAWHWLHWPSERMLTASYHQDLANRDSLRSKDIIRSDWYQARWGNIYQLRKGQDKIERYANDKTGWRKAVNVGGATGQRAHVRVLDDPHNIADAYRHDTKRESDISWIRNTWSQRGADKRRDLQVIVMQRLHENDASGYYLREVGGFVHLCIPMEYEPNRKWISVLNNPLRQQDPRTVPGQLLDPGRKNQADVEAEKKILGPYASSGQLQQRPAPEAGGIFKKSWWRLWHYPNSPLPDYKLMDESGEIHVLKCEPLPDYLDKETQSWDCSFEAGINNDYVAGQHWGKRGSKSYALRYVLEKMDFVPTEKAVKEMASFFQIVPSKILVEKAGNGPAVISSLSARIPGIVGIDPRGSKRARASAYSPVVEAGNCYLPHPDIAPWTLKFIENMAVFPNGLHDDDTDSWSQAMNYLYGKSRQVSPVFAMEFEENIHVSRKPLRPVQGLRAFRFWHGGMSPVCMIGQQSRRGGVVLYHCLQAEGMGIEEFIRMRVMPILNEFYPWPLEWVDIGPPSMIMSNQKDPSVQERPAEIIERLLRTTFTQGTKDWSTRREASKEIFNRRSGLLINCERTPGESGHYLLDAVRDDYGYEIDETTKQVKKDAPYDKVPAYAVGEALTFGLSYLYAPPLQGIPRSSGKKEMQKRAASYATD